LLDKGANITLVSPKDRKAPTDPRSTSKEAVTKATERYNKQGDKGEFNSFLCMGLH